jgi:CheY-like chemotaxis protein
VLRRRRGERPLRGRGRFDRPRPLPASRRFRATHGSGPTRAAHAERILVVDDERAIRLICRVNLESAGYETLEAEDGRGALEVAQAEQPDLIVLDVMLPDLDGWEIAELLAGDPATEEIPLIYVSARSEPSDQRRAHALGALGYITKPFDPEALSLLVNEVIRRVRRGERDALRDEWLRDLESGS